jgi:hypothetical protein
MPNRVQEAVGWRAVDHGGPSRATAMRVAFG